MSLRPFQPRLLMSLNLLRTAERPHSVHFLPGHSHTLKVWECLLYNFVRHSVWNVIWSVHLPRDRFLRQMSSHKAMLTWVDNVTWANSIFVGWNLCKNLKEIALQAAKQTTYACIYFQKMTWRIFFSCYYGTFKIAAKRVFPFNNLICTCELAQGKILLIHTQTTHDNLVVYSNLQCRFLYGWIFHTQWTSSTFGT